MHETTKRLLYWTPRILCIAFAAFISIFAMDVFSMPLDFWHKALALLMHLIPTAIVLIVLVVVWRGSGSGRFYSRRSRSSTW
jgi:TRAP-type C4-dicarboxylate transport system permease small subunit